MAVTVAQAQPLTEFPLLLVVEPVAMTSARSHHQAQDQMVQAVELESQHHRVRQVEWEVTPSMRLIPTQPSITVVVEVLVDHQPQVRAAMVALVDSQEAVEAPVHQHRQHHSSVVQAAMVEQDSL
jgi:hypothetical protein